MYSVYVHDGTPGDAAGQRNWARAMETYRSALSTYRRLVEIKQARRGYLPVGGLISVPAERDAAPVTGYMPVELNCLTAREREVARLIARGYTNQQIAETLVLTRGTVANHVAHILSKVGASNRTQIAAYVFDGDRRPPPRLTDASGVHGGLDTQPLRVSLARGVGDAQDQRHDDHHRD